MPEELTVEYNMRNWREATKDWKFITYYTQYLYDTSPASELWLFNNSDAIASVQRGLDDAAQGRVSKVDLDTL